MTAAVRDRPVPEALAKALVRDAASQQPPHWPPLHVAHLLEAGILSAGAELTAFYKGRRCRATITADGHLGFNDGRVCKSPSAAAKHVTGGRGSGGRGSDGRVCKSPSAAAKHVTGGRGSGGWRFWNWEDRQSRRWFTLAELREHLLELLSEDLHRRRAYY